MPQGPIASQINATNPGGTVTPVKQDGNGNLRAVNGGGKYVACPASATTALGTGAIGDVLNKIVIVPGTSAAGIVQIKDGANAAITVFAGGGTTALTDLRPQEIELDAVSVAGGWSIVANANVTVIAVGQFTA